MLIYAINGSGSPKDPKKDGNLKRYVEPIADDASEEMPDLVMLLGGGTNRPELPEAIALKEAIACHAPELMDRIWIETSQTMARGNAEVVANTVKFKRKQGEDVYLVYNCEYTRRWEMRFYLLLFLRSPFGWTVRGRPFAHDALEFKARWTRYLVHTPLTIAAEMLPPARWVKRWLRGRHVANERAKAQTSA